ncbi:ProQ/FINO family protein [Escherichia coli]|nr:ProQ/FINO family protein [Escherichia coli]MCY6437885.1 ProQ/FINO family protein [Escherichia coli]MDN5166324.1 ProQ/FINO family protein [Escherichia coli]
MTAIIEASMQPKKTPVIVVKKRRVLVMPENPVVNEKPQEVQKSAVNENKKVQKKDAVAEKTRKKQPQPWYLKKQITFPPKYPKEYFEKCFNKVRAVFPELWTDEKKNLPLKSGILQDVEKYLADNPDVDLTIEEWNCAVQVMTFRWQYLQNCTVPGATRYDLYGKPAGTVKKHTQLMRNWFSMPVRKPARRNN